MGKLISLVSVLLVCVASPAFAAEIAMNGSDTMGQSSFNSGLHWTGGAAPSAGNGYVTGNYRLRTPTGTGSHTFAGDSLTVNNTNGYDGGLMYKGSGSAGTITVNNLILDGGMIVTANGSSDVFNLYGNLNVVSASEIYAKQGPLNVYSTISGSGTITNPGADAGGNILRFQSSANTWTGSLVNNGVFSMGTPGGRLNFVIGADGVNNSISGTGTGYLTGVFAFDLTGADTALGSSWTIASMATQDFQATFSVLDFTDLGNDVWQKSANDVVYEFSEATGVLTVVPEPATLAVLGLGGLLLRRKRH